MGLGELKQEIRRQAEAEADRILSAAHKEAEAVKAQARAEAEEKRRRADEETERLLESMRQRETAALSLESKKLLIAAKKSVIDETFRAARERLSSLPAAERKKALEALLKRSRAELDVARVYCNEKDLASISGVPAKGADLLGGLIAENADATVRVDYSFETLLAEARERHLEEIAAAVFGKD